MPKQGFDAWFSNRKKAQRNAAQPALVWRCTIHQSWRGDRLAPGPGSAHAKDQNQLDVTEALKMFTTPFGFQSTAAQVLEGVDLAGKRAIVTGASSGIG